MTATGTDLRPRRLVLLAVELELLRRRLGLAQLPPGFEVGGQDDGNGDSAFAPVVAALADRGVVRADASGNPLACAVHPSVAANLAVLGRPEMLVQTKAHVRTTSVQAAHGVAAGLGASLIRLDDEAVELSLFPATALGVELARAVPESGRVREGRPTAVVRLEALEQVGPARQAGGSEVVSRIAAELGLGLEELAAVERLEAVATGLLQSLVFGTASGDAQAMAVGQVVWFATTEGWVGARPEPGPAGERLVRLVPVERIDLGAWVAPLVAAVIG